MKQKKTSSGRERVLLVGNGINANSPGYKWRDLISELISEFGRGNKIEQGNKPFPMLYEEIVLKSGDRVLREREIKEFIAEKVQRIEPTRIHDEIAKASFDTILTTNYDYSLEAAMGANGRRLKNEGFVKETRYSLFRHSLISGTKLWHIHGEARSPNSILLGYEQYCGYLQYMRNYVATGVGENYGGRIETLERRMKRGDRRILSWVDHFFLSDVYILGLTMDFVEMHLWWILTYRARALKSGLVPIRNKVVFFVPRQYAEGSKEKLQLLGSCGLMVHSLIYDTKSRGKYYRLAVRMVIDS